MGALVFGFGAPAGAANYPPDTSSIVTIEGASANHGGSAVAASPAGLPRTGGNSTSMVWVGGVFVVAGAALAVSVRGRRRSARP